MQDTLKIGTAALGGYVLGRTKKAKAAIGLALWLTGRGRARDLARDQALKLLQSDRGQEMLSQMRGPVLAAGRQAAVALVEAQAGRLTGGLQRRAEKLGTDTVTGGTDTAKRLTRRRRRDQEPEEEPEEEYADEYEYEDEDEDETYEPEDEEGAYEPEDEADEADEDEYTDEELEDEQEPEEDEDEGEDEPEPEPKRPTRRRSRRAA